MIISRYRTTVKRGRLKEAALFAKNNFPNPKRVCACFAGDNDVLHVDFEFEDAAAFSAFLKTFLSGAAGSLPAEWVDLTVSNENELLFELE